MADPTPAHRRPLPERVAALFPYPARRVDVGGGQEMAVVDEGPRDAPPVLLLHGNPTWGFLWRRFVPPLLAAGHRVVVPDLVGFGRSSKPADPAYYSAERQVANLARALAPLDLRGVTLAVHDWGGPVGLGWAARHRDRVARIAIFNSLAFPPRRARPLSRFHALMGSRLGELLTRDLGVAVPLMMRLGVARPGRMGGATLAAYQWPFPDKGSRTSVLAMARAVPSGPDHPTVPLLREIEAAFPDLAKRPALVLWGDRDRVFPPRLAERWPAALPGARLVRFPEAGHFLQEDEPEKLAAELAAFAAGPS